MIGLEVDKELLFMEERIGELEDLILGVFMLEEWVDVRDGIGERVFLMGDFASFEEDILILGEGEGMILEEDLRVLRGREPRIFEEEGVRGRSGEGEEAGEKEAWGEGIDEWVIYFQGQF